MFNAFISAMLLNLSLTDLSQFFIFFLVVKNEAVLAQCNSQRFDQGLPLGLFSCAGEEIEMQTCIDCTGSHVFIVSHLA